MAKEEYIRWPADADIPLMLSLADTNGAGATGKTPQVSIRRSRETHGAPLDNFYWDGATFTATPFWHTLAEVDAIGSPGLYSYLFEQSLIGLENTYTVYYRHLVDPYGFAIETHVITNEVYIPNTQPDPVVIGPQTVMGQLELVKALLHHNGMVDKQTYENGMLTAARVRMFDIPNHVPLVPGGNETLGLLVEFQIVSEYDEEGLNKKFVLKRVFP